MDETLEPIQPIMDTPYGALVIHNDILCAPTSLCTWTDDKPEVYCQLPVHTLSPVCREVNKGIGLLGCYNDSTCGGMIPESKTDQILKENPDYISILRKQENKIKKKQQSKKKFPLYAIIILLIVLVIWSAFLASFLYKKYKKHRFTRIQKRSASHKILSGAGKTGRLSSK